MSYLPILTVLASCLLLGGVYGQVHNIPLAAAAQANCQIQADLLFIMDSSGSIMPTDYDKMLQFVVEITKKFNLGPNDVQFGGIVFGTTATRVFDFNTYSDRPSLEQGILATPHISGQTYTDQALDLARTESFTPQYGARPGVPKIAIVFTDGQSSNAVSMTKAAQDLKASGVSVMAIGVGSGIDVAELQTIASSNNDVYTVTGFDVLDSIETQVANKTCSFVSAITPTRTQCNAADILFLMDASGSVGTTNFNTMLNFIANITSSFNLGPMDVQFGAITFGDTANIVFDLDSYTDHALLEQAIMSSPYQGGSTYTDQALELARQQAFTSAFGARGNVSDIVIIFTDGQSTSPTATATQVQLLKDAGVTVMSVGIGSNVKQSELELMASTPDDVFQVATYDVLNTIQASLTNKTCSIGNPILLCDVDVDIMFIMDSSASIDAADYDKMLNFVVDVTRNFNLANDTVRFGAMVYGDKPEMVFDLDEYTNHSQIEQGLLAAPHLQESTHTDLALQLAWEEAFTPYRGARPGVPKIAIVLTDGQSIDENRTAEQAQLLKDTGALVMSVGISNKVDPQELATIASAPEYVFQVANFDVLNSIQKEMANMTCRAVATPTPPPSTTPQPGPRCHDFADIIFVLDSSGSISPSNYLKELTFAANVTQSFSMGPNEARFGAVIFGSDSEKVFDLRTYSNHSSILQGLINAKHMKTGTNLTEALELVYNTAMFDPAYGGRYNASKFLLVLTDGQSTSPIPPDGVAQALKNIGVQIISIGIGNSVDVQELNDIASSPQDVFLTSDYNTLHQILQDVSNRTCGNISPPVRTCSELADVIFVIDSSDGVSTSVHEQQLEFVANVTQEFDISPFDARFGALLYADDVLEVFNLKDYTNHADLTSSLDGASHLSGQADLGGALEWVNDQGMFDPASGGRVTAPKILVILDDGLSVSPAQSIQAADTLKNSGVQIMPVGIENYNLNELQQLSSGLHSVFKVSHPSLLPYIKQELVNAICDYAKEYTTI